MDFSNEKKLPVELEVTQVIILRFTRGTGVDDDPYRLVEQYWSMKGYLLFEKDANLQ